MSQGMSLEVLRDAVAAAPEDAQAANALGDGLHAAGEEHEAVTWWEKAKLRPQSQVIGTSA